MKNKSLLVAAIASSIGLTAMAEVKTSSDWEFYGRAHLSFDKLDDGATLSENALSSNSSRLGFRGSKDFSGLKGIWQIESEVNFNMKEDGTNEKNRLATRDTFAGLEGGFGVIRVGKFDTPFKIAREPANLFGDQLGDMRNITRKMLKFDERPNNIMEYKTPEFGGLRLAAAYSPHADSSPSATAKTGMSSYSLTYTDKNLTAAAASESYEQNSADGKRSSTRLAAAYKLSPVFKVVGFHQKDKDEDGDATIEGNKTTGYGAEYQIDPNKLAIKFAVMGLKTDAANKGAKMTTIGLEKIVDKQLRFYANYAKVDNESSQSVVVWKEGRTAAPSGTSGKDGKGLSVGMRYDF
jgi:predicted porin